ncbi:MAG: HAD-IIB family hydrolase [Syntrophorhabdales bacterium]
MALVIFTDLDGTLLDGAYSFQAAARALRLVRRASIPCIICSSKTRREIEHYRDRLENTDPFVSENGGGIFVPAGYFGFRLAGWSPVGPEGSPPVIDEEAGYEIIRLGVPYAGLRAALAEWRTMGYPVTGFGDMSAEKVAALTGLSLHEAAMARMREFDEPFLLDSDERDRTTVIEAARRKGLRVTEGREFLHLAGGSDKGKAVRIVSSLFTHARGSDLVFAALGDGPNDLAMLEAADRPIIIQRPDGSYDPRLRGRGFIEAGGAGPDGWNRAVLKLLEETQRQR